jgi:hypothetical protein
VVALLCALAAAGCVAGPSSGPTSPNLPFDGLFQGHVTPLAVGATSGVQTVGGSATGGQGGGQVVSGPPACPGDEYGTIQIGDGTFVFAYRPNIIFVTAIAHDGAIKAEVRGTTLDGKLADDVLEVTVSNPTCKTHYQLSRLLGM